MRQILGAAWCGALLLAAAQASARDYPYCLQGGDYGLPGNCQFTSYQQCEATASGTISYCGANPRFAPGWLPGQEPHSSVNPPPFRAQTRHKP
jgi:hypothetical protein